MQRLCTACGAEIPSRFVSDDLDAARCPACGTLVDLRGEKVIPRRPAIAVPVPERWTVEESGSQLRVRWRWFGWTAVLLIPFAAFWNGVILFMLAGMSQGFTHPARLLFALLIPHVWVGLALVYWVVASFLNSTTIEAGLGQLTVRVGPVPAWRANHSFAAGDLQQLFVVEHKNKQTSYDLCAVMRDGKKKTLVRGLDHEDQARFLENRIERILAIEDRPVEGELRRA